MRRKKNFKFNVTRKGKTTMSIRPHEFNSCEHKDMNADISDQLNWFFLIYCTFSSTKRQRSKIGYFEITQIILFKALFRT